MATNYDLLSSCNSSESSSEDENGNFKRIDLSFHNLDSESLENHILTLYPDRESKEVLQKAFLYNNRLEIIPSSIYSLINLQVLDLSNNLISDVPLEMNNLVNLTQLFLRNNFIGDDSFPKELTGLSKLRDLNLSGNQLTTIPEQILGLPLLRNFFLGGNRIASVPAQIKRLKRLRVFYLGGNRLKNLPDEIGELSHLHALILCNNQLESLPNCICYLRRLECLQLHQNRLTTLPQGLIHLDSLSELSLRDNPLIVRFVREMSFQPSSLLELAARVITINKVAFEVRELPLTLSMYLQSSHRCVNPQCKGVYFNTKVEHIKFVDFCGKYKIPLMQYLCSSRCSANKPAVTRSESPEEETSKMRRVLLG